MELSQSGPYAAVAVAVPEPDEMNRRLWLAAIPATPKATNEAGRDGNRCAERPPK